MTSFRRFWRGPESELGQAIMIVAGAMTVMLLMVGLAIDTGRLFVERRTLQEAADAGAYAGAVVIYQGGTSTQAIAAAVADVTKNGYTHGDNGGTTTVIARVPQSPSPNAGDLDFVEVIIQTRVLTAILPAIQRDLTLVNVRAVAGAEPLNNGYAVISLENGDVDDALKVGCTGSISITGAGILVNSTSTQAAYNCDNDGSNVSIIPPFELDVAGDAVGGWGIPDEGAEQQPNPFAGFPKPSTGGLTTYNGIPADNADGVNDGVVTLNPGIWTVELKASGGETFRLSSGIYILKDGMASTGATTVCSAVIDTSGADPVCTTTSNGGVFLFNTVSGYPGTTGTCGSLNINGNNRSILYPMTTGTYAGMLIYQDEICTAEMKIAGTGELEASGTIYLPNADFVMAGTNATLTGSQVVAETVDIQQGNLNLTFDAGTTAQPILPRLAE